MATIVGDWPDVDGAAKVVVAAVVGEGNGSDVEVDAAASGVGEDSARVTAQAPLAATSATATITTSGAGRFHHGRLCTCLPRMVSTLAERADRSADGWACERPHGSRSVHARSLIHADHGQCPRRDSRVS
jgi:hypothetical protein